MTSRFTLVIREGDVLEDVFFTDEAGKNERLAWIRESALDAFEITIIDNLTQAWTVEEILGADDRLDDEA
jgi:hypothetical protein